MTRPRQSYVPCAMNHHKRGSKATHPRARAPLADNQPARGVVLSIVRAWKAWKRNRRHG